MNQPLTSVKLQPMINLNGLNMDLWCPVLKFGKLKRNHYNFPIVFKEYEPASELFKELKKLIGEDVATVKKAADPLYEKFKSHHYLNEK